MCVRPITIYVQKKDNHIRVPCSQCPECIKNRTNSWIFRINQHLKISDTSCFLTLTYNDENLPLNKGFPTLDKKHVQNFIKSLRQEQKYFTNQKLTYYAVGEYGTKFGRPHYHLLLFNVHPKINYDRVWKKGHSYPLPLKQGSIKYVLKYMSKTKTKTKNSPQLREFSLMSKGLGANYMTESIKKFHIEDLENCFVRTKEGYKMPLPKYYKEKLYTDEQREEVTWIQQQRAEEHHNKKVKNLLKITNNPVELLQLRKDNTKFDPRLREKF